MPSTLPTFSRGLKLVRFAVWAILAQLTLTIVMTLKGTSSEGMRDLLKWMQYFLLVNASATALMCFAAARSIPELARAGVDVRGLVISAIGFLIATLALAWSYHVIAAFMDVVLDPDSTLEDLAERASDVKSLSMVAIIKDLAYGFGLTY